MPQFAVRYVHAPGQLREAVIDAADEAGVPAVLQVRAADVVTVRALGGGAGATAAGRRGAGSAGPQAGAARPASGGRATAFPLRLFCQELAVLLDAGLPLFEAIQTLAEKESSGATAAVLQGLLLALEQGQTFAQALQAQQRAFSPLFVASIEASQRTGQIPQALKQHAEYLAWLGGLRDKLVSASIYPVILISASLLVMAFLTIFVVPRFAQIYADMGGDLPWMSRAMLQFGQAVGDHPGVTAAVLLGLVAGAVMAWRSPAVRAALAARLWRLPKVGERFRLLELASLYRTLGLLLQAGVPMVAALQASAGLVSASLRGPLDAATEGVRQGLRLSDTLQAQGLTTPVSLRMIRTGEHSGELGAMLERAAVFYDEELARFTEWVGKVVSPALMLIMGVLIGGIVVLMYLPIFQVAEQIQ